MSIKSKILAGLAAVSPVAVFAEGEATPSTIPGLQTAIDTAKDTATAMAGQVVPAAVVILFAFAGLVGVYLVWRVFRRGAGGR